MSQNGGGRVNTRPADPHDDPDTPVQRLDITPRVQRRLFLLSGNECAFADCREVLAPESGGYFGEIAHIRAAEKGGPRFDPAMTNNQRRHIDNLVLLCVKHHQLIDDAETTARFDRAALEDIKRRHEDRIRRVLQAMERAEQQYVDRTRTQTVVHCSTLERMYGSELDEDDRRGTAESVNKIADQMRRAALAARQLLCQVLEEGGELSVGEAAHRGGLSKTQVYELGLQLERLWLARLEEAEWDDPGYRPERITLPDPIHDHNELLDYDFFNDLLRHAASRDDDVLNDVVVGLDFSVLD
ncbi:hypothetical protein FE633_12800 [Streptomyces montanus]|uniref:HNH endonuclease n=1 Tax=Streptomyces montanus TaxID=2580423 RepID=A0A5R9FQN6_9ACTN|nr:hypothetical protein [Streptomyces montanus]TLS45651.1 hypothetical protein FE633_12800 [Streptomyces montanus]